MKSDFAFYFALDDSIVGITPSKAKSFFRGSTKWHPSEMRFYRKQSLYSVARHTSTVLFYNRFSIFKLDWLWTTSSSFCNRLFRLDHLLHLDF